ncbi:MAG: guanylate kinase [Oligoflexia bacterium]|nr:guanylate kinase [Oligoflexia bacterium]
MKKPKLIVISAPSGTGKTTLCARLLKDLSSMLTLSISSTTRPPRGKEQHGIEYFFLSTQDFEVAIQRGHFAEHARVHDNYYGTSRDAIESNWKQGKSVLLDIDVQGAASLKKAYPDETVRIFIAPPSLEALEQRLRKRGTDPEETIQKRLKNAEKEMSHMKRFDYVIVNDDLERAYRQLRDIVAQEI